MKDSTLHSSLSISLKMGANAPLNMVGLRGDPCSMPTSFRLMSLPVSRFRVCTRTQSSARTVKFVGTPASCKLRVIALCASRGNASRRSTQTTNVNPRRKSCNTRQPMWSCVLAPGRRQQRMLSGSRDDRPYIPGVVSAGLYGANSARSTTASRRRDSAGSSMVRNPPPGFSMRMRCEGE